MASVLLFIAAGILVMLSIIYGFSKFLSNGDTKVKNQPSTKENVNLIKDEYTRPNNTMPTTDSRVNYSKRTVRIPKTAKPYNTSQKSNGISNRNNLQENNPYDVGINPYLFSEIEDNIRTEPSTNHHESCHRDEPTHHRFESDNPHSHLGGNSSTSDCSSSGSSYDSSSSNSSYSSSSSSYDSGSSSSSYSSSSSSYDSGSSSSSYSSSSSSYDSGSSSSSSSFD